MAYSDLNFLPCGELLGSGESPTRPYEVALDEMVPWGDLVRPSSLHTVPMSLDELPEDAYPTELLLVEEVDLD